MDYLYRIEIEPITLVLDEWSRPFFVQTTDWKGRLGKLPSRIIGNLSVSRNIVERVKTSIKPDYIRGAAGEHLDHINRNAWDWREPNIRIVSCLENNQNRGKYGEGDYGVNISYLGQTKNWEGYSS